MTRVHLVLGVLVTALFAAAALVGGWRWWRVEASPWFWRLLRAGQAVLVIEVALGGAMYLRGDRPCDDLRYVYGLVPLAVSFVGEQLRLTSAETVLAARELPDARAVGALPEHEQRSVATAILRRELGVMALSAAVVAGLAARAGFA